MTFVLMTTFTSVASASSAFQINSATASIGARTRLIRCKWSLFTWTWTSFMRRQYWRTNGTYARFLSVKERNAALERAVRVRDSAQKGATVNRYVYLLSAIVRTRTLVAEIPNLIA